jgi:hypothetical protein
MTRLNPIQQVIALLGLVAFVYVVFMEPVTYTHKQIQQETVSIAPEQATTKLERRTGQRTISRELQEIKVDVAKTATRGGIALLVTLALMGLFRDSRKH